MSDLLRRHAERATGDSRLGTARPSPSPRIAGDAPADFLEDVREVVIREPVVGKPASAPMDTSPGTPPTPAPAPRTEPAEAIPSRPMAPTPVQTVAEPEPTQPPRDVARARPAVANEPLAVSTGKPVAPMAAPRIEPIGRADSIRPESTALRIRDAEAHEGKRPVVTVRAAPAERPPPIVRELQRVPVPAEPSRAALPAVEHPSAPSGDPATAAPDPAPPPIRITIGRVDVRASLAAPDPPAQAKPQAERATLPLADYLAGRGTSR